MRNKRRKRESLKRQADAQFRKEEKKKMNAFRDKVEDRLSERFYLAEAQREETLSIESDEAFRAVEAGMHASVDISPIGLPRYLGF